MKQDRIVTDLLIAIKQLQAVAPRIGELQRRDAERVGPDGFGSGTKDGDGRRVVGDHSDPTYNAALGKEQRDLIHEHTTALLDHLRQACDHANKAAGYVQAIAHHVDQHTGRRNLVDVCPACDEPMPQPRAGMCEPDYRRWVYAGRPERAPWINEQRRERAQREDAA